MTDRTILRVSGPDARDFLQGLVTNDVNGLDTGMVYAALLTPQGKYLADFFLVPEGPNTLIDVHAAFGPGLLQRLYMYKLRARVEISETDLHLHRGLGDPPKDAFSDPRHNTLGWRAYRNAPASTDMIDWDAIRVAALIPETGIELHQGTFILEAGFEDLNGVDFRKGCYVGQEVTARMKHKTELRKGLVRVALEAPVAAGTDVTSDGKVVGQIHTVSGLNAIAYLRFGRAGGALEAGGVAVTLDQG